MILNINGKFVPCFSCGGLAHDSEMFVCPECEVEHPFCMDCLEAGLEVEVVRFDDKRAFYLVSCLRPVGIGRVLRGDA